MATLDVHDVRVAFAGLVALDQVNLHVEAGEILGLIGPNGAGKSTLVNVISGFQRPDRGRIALDGRDVTGMPPHRRGRMGLARTFQGVRIFPRLTVEENVECGALGQGASRRAARATARDIIGRIGLDSVRDLPAGALPFGRERQLALARALATGPKILLLDEPAAGLDDRESEELAETIRTVRDDVGCGVLVIEHDMPLIMRLCSRVQVLAEGRTLSVGSPEQVQQDPAVIEAYLGSGEGDRAHA